MCNDTAQLVRTVAQLIPLLGTAIANWAQGDGLVENCTWHTVCSRSVNAIGTETRPAMPNSSPQRTRATAFGLKEGEQSGSFPVGDRAQDGMRLESDAVIAELAPELVSLIPEPPPAAWSAHPRGPTPSERAELVIEDLSLSLENPYIASSLVPPPKRPFPIVRALAIGAGMLTAAAIGAAIQLSTLHGSRSEAHAETGGVASPAPVVVAAAAKPAQLEALVAAAPMQAAAVAVTPSEAAPNELAPVEVALAPVPVAGLEAARVAPKAVVPVAAAKPEALRPTRAIAPPAPPEPVAPPLTQPVAPAPVAVDLPAYPSRQQVTAGFEAMRGALKQCAAGRGGRIEVKASVTSNGRVVHALIDGDFEGSPEGSCMARAVREAQFPAFSQPRLKVSYPFAL